MLASLVSPNSFLTMNIFRTPSNVNYPHGNIPNVFVFVKIKKNSLSKHVFDQLKAEPHRYN
jgi:hypothetical protein